MQTLLIESQQKRQVASLSDSRTPRLPAFQLGDTLELAIAEVEEIATPISDRLFEPQDQTGVTYRAALGVGFHVPVAGTFTLTYGADTTDPIAFDASADDIEQALNSLASIVAAGYVDVTGENGFYVVSFRDEGTRTLIAGNAGALVPASLIDIGQQITGDTDEWEVQVIRIVQSAGAIASLTSASASAGIGVETVQAGGGGRNHQVRVSLTGEVYSGTWTFLTADGESEPIGYDDTAGQVRRALEAIAGVGTGNLRVQAESAGVWLITFIGDLANTAISGIDVDGSNLVALPKKSGTLPLTGSALQMLLNGSEARVVSLEIERQLGSDAPEKILRRDVLLTRPVIEPAMGDTEATTSNIAAVLSTFVGNGSTLTLSTGGTTDLAPATPFMQWTQRVTINAGSGAYTRKFTLDTSNAVEGAKFEVILTIAASANPTIQFFNESVSGTQLGVDLTGDPDNAQIVIAQFTFNGGTWLWDSYRQ